MVLPETIIYQTFLSVVTLTGICMNMFFAFCMLSDEQRSLKAPLPVLLATAVFHNILLQVLLPIFTFKETWEVNSIIVISALIIHFGASSMSSNVWLSIFYYTKIVSSQNRVFVWVKRNINSVVYAGLIVDKIYLMLFTISVVVPSFLATPANVSSLANTTAGLEDRSVWNSIRNVFRRVHIGYLLTFIWLMMWVWSCTLVYICRHMRSMEGSSSPFSNPKLLSQLRVVAQGIVQTVLYAISAGSQLIGLFSYFVVLDVQDRVFLYNASIAVYTLGTTINLGLSQHLFRQRAVKVMTTVTSGDGWKCKKRV
ncbi:taste receptor type 2 member 114 [Alosa alosa]|uniref:taste receptor type 2 member 114 n=1 Tax=Alosa alosa TaxID=278164 RepID=UPI0020150C96|nr:taste receptor type 2 member 114 [Alosa alosa]